MSTITECYQRYRIPPNLQRHMLRVAAVADLLAADWSGPPLKRAELRRVLLVHDMGNLVKCDYQRLPEMLEEEQGRVAYWTGVQESYRTRFGTDAELATRTLAEEIGLDDEEMGLLDGMTFGRNEQTRAADDFTVKVAAYADQRVAPGGVVSLADRFEEAKQRYTSTSQPFMASPRARTLFDAVLDIEQQVFRHTRVDPPDINDESVRPIVDRLRTFEL